MFAKFINFFLFIKKKNKLKQKFIKNNYVLYKTRNNKKQKFINKNI